MPCVLFVLPSYAFRQLYSTVFIFSFFEVFSKRSTCNFSFRGFCVEGFLDLLYFLHRFFSNVQRWHRFVSIITTCYTYLPGHINIPVLELEVACLLAAVEYFSFFKFEFLFHLRKMHIYKLYHLLFQYSFPVLPCGISLHL